MKKIFKFKKIASVLVFSTLLSMLSFVLGKKNDKLSITSTLDKAYADVPSGGGDGFGGFDSDSSAGGGDVTGDGNGVDGNGDVSA